MRTELDKLKAANVCGCDDPSVDIDGAFARAKAKKPTVAAQQQLTIATEAMKEHRRRLVTGSDRPDMCLDIAERALLIAGWL